MTRFIEIRNSMLGGRRLASARSLIVAVALLTSWKELPALATDVEAGKLEFFEKKVRPLLVDH